jgi:predicted nucleic acid-binding protein
VTAVIDASVLTEVAVNSPLGVQAVRQLEAHVPNLHVADLAIVEAVSALRRLARQSVLHPTLATQALSDLLVFPARHWPVAPLAWRVWELRANFSAYDASHVALAETLGATLMTSDLAMARAADAWAACPVEPVGL